MYENDRKKMTDYEYNHALDELMQMRTKVDTNLNQYRGKQIEWSNGEFGIIEDCFSEDMGIKVKIKDVGLIEFEREDFFEIVKA